MNNFKLLERFLESRKNEGSQITGAFGYGSGVFKQIGNTPSVIDTILIVKDAKSWHQYNMKKNPKDYSFTGKIALKVIDLNKIKCLTGVTYQYNIPFENAKFKYGIIEENRFLHNLRAWDKLFIPGRFQKLILPIKSNSDIDEAIERNRKSAIQIALLTLPQGTHSLKDLYTQLCSLSYKGDIRMLFAENPNKIKNIAESNFIELFKLYGTSNEFFYTLDDGTISINYDVLYDSMHLLPASVFEYLYDNGYLVGGLPKIKERIQKYLVGVNRKDSIAQPVTGLLTIGPIASVNYVGQKIYKRFK